MYYDSRMPQVVGAFDAAGLHARIDAVTGGDTNLHNYTVQQRLGNGTHVLMHQVVSIDYAGSFNPAAFADIHNGNVNELQHVTAGQVYDVDAWHADTMTAAQRLKCIAFLTGSSCWPTEFLIGRIGLSTNLKHKQYVDPNKYWDSPAGKEDLAAAIHKGDAYVQQFNPGDILNVPAGTLHRRAVPIDWSGYRYFMRKFPRHGLLRSCTTKQRLKPS